MACFDSQIDRHERTNLTRYLVVERLEFRQDSLDFGQDVLRMFASFSGCSLKFLNSLSGCFLKFLNSLFRCVLKFLNSLSGCFLKFLNSLFRC